MAHRRQGCEASPQNSWCLLLLLVAFATVVCNHSASADDATSLPESLSTYSNVALLDPRFELYWTVNSSDATIHMAVNAKTTGWFAIGISEIGSMVGSDALVAWVAQSEARAYATDRFIFNKTTAGIALDDKQDWHVLGGSQTKNQSTGDTWTTVHVWRRLDTGDCNDRPIVSGKLHNVIWAMGATADVSYHSSDRGVSALVLAPAPGPSIIAPTPPPSASASASASAASDSLRAFGRLAAQPQAGKQQQQPLQESMLNFTFTNYRVPTNHTTYRCKFLCRIKFLQPLSRARDPSAPICTDLHPFAPLYRVPRRKECGSLKGAGADFDCLHDTPCATTVAMWAVGGRPFTYPPNVGYPIGPGYFTKFVLQVHFTNPKGRADLIDNSGLYLKLALSLRPMDASIMLTGPVAYEYLIRIPPGMPSWTQVSSCPGECTTAVFKNESVKIIGSVLHLHTLGRQVGPRFHSEQATRPTTPSPLPHNLPLPLPPFVPPSLPGSLPSFPISPPSHPNSDFASQQTIPTTPEFELLPGDELRTSCVWESTARTNVTVGGPSTEDEMCIDYLIYYPARQGQEMDMCYDMCASYENGTLGMDPNSPTLSKFYACGPNFIPTYQPCKITFGANTPMEVLNGCPAE
ncbi:unnamed protein product [Closterium sp. Yama58-4]|nr:unnamed protein product [Closterium sp. Yama58-4]